MWNIDLANDWKLFQKDSNVDYVYPLKLRYAIINKGKSVENKDFITYAVASTSLYSNSKLVEIEKKIIRDLCKITKILKIKLHIKPRPISSPFEFDEFKKFPHVYVGYHKSPEENASSYFLSDDYNKRRFEEISKSKFVINCFTTFGLDSILYGVPVLQVDISNIYPGSKDFYDNHHIKKYLLNSSNIFKVENNFQEEFIKKFNNNKLMYNKYSKELYNWISPSKSIQDSIDDIAAYFKNL